MQIKRIQCPQCGAVLDVKNSKNETIKLISCPSCRAELKVKFAPQQAPLEAQTFYAAPLHSAKANDGETHLSEGLSGATQLYTSTPSLGVKAYLLFGGVRYLLKEGRNIVGRKGNTSEATVQIDTADRYMSRHHCCITVKSLADGSKKAVLSNYQNMNRTLVDGQSVEKEDNIRLTDGNRITMGHTTITFKLS